LDAGPQREFESTENSLASVVDSRFETGSVLLLGGGGIVLDWGLLFDGGVVDGC